MYSELVKTLNINDFLIELVDLHTFESYDKSTTIEDIAVPIDNTEGLYLPDWSIRGFFRYETFKETPTFYPSNEGDHILYITGVPKGIGLDLFKFKQNVIHLAYWEDNTYGYYIQIIKIL